MLLADGHARWDHELSLLGWLAESDIGCLHQVANALYMTAWRQRAVVDDVVFCDVVAGADKDLHPFIRRSFACVHPADPRDGTSDEQHRCQDGAGTSVARRYEAILGAPPPTSANLVLLPPAELLDLGDDGVAEVWCPGCGNRSFVKAFAEHADPLAGTWRLCPCGDVRKTGWVARDALSMRGAMSVAPDQIVEALGTIGIGPLFLPRSRRPDGPVRRLIGIATLALPDAMWGGDRDWRSMIRLAAIDMDATPRTAGADPEAFIAAWSLAGLLKGALAGLHNRPVMRQDMAEALTAGPHAVHDLLAGDLPTGSRLEEYFTDQRWELRLRGWPYPAEKRGVDAQDAVVDPRILAWAYVTGLRPGRPGDGERGWRSEPFNAGFNLLQSTVYAT
ncbi:hypothetical protein [Catenulispora pinisilvae]|uniref:hypothetical protein n=1 Tax=Catenulispora pinisilvae TaxID=2705253 RepID=UPI001890FC69|nr:hypothetical protein [Catenulispora pinisilvae]